MTSLSSVLLGKSLIENFRAFLLSWPQAACYASTVRPAYRSELS